MSIIPPLVLILAAIGLLISTYFTAISYRWVNPKSSWIPSFCQMGEHACDRVIFTPRARILDIPNSVLGQIFYLAIIVGVLSGFTFLSPFFYLYLTCSLLTVLLGVYLTYSLLFLTKIACVLCFTSHGINLVIFFLLLGHGC